MKSLIVFNALLVLLLPGWSFAQEGQDEEGKKNELAVFVGLTSSESNPAFTYGFDYQYRLSELIGIGAVVDRATGTIASTLLGLALFLHFDQFELALVPAVEFIDDETNITSRIGFEYEFELAEKYSLAPTLCLDLERRMEFALVFGLSFGMKF